MNGPSNEEDRPTQDGDEENRNLGDDGFDDDTSLPRQYTYNKLKSMASIRGGKRSTVVKV